MGHYIVSPYCLAHVTNTLIQVCLQRPQIENERILRLWIFELLLENVLVQSVLWANNTSQDDQYVRNALINKVLPVSISFIKNLSHVAQVDFSLTSRQSLLLTSTSFQVVILLQLNLHDVYLIKRERCNNRRTSSTIEVNSLHNAKKVWVSVLHLDNSTSKSSAAWTTSRPSHRPQEFSPHIAQPLSDFKY